MKRLLNPGFTGILLLLALPVTISGQLGPKEIDRLVEEAMERFNVAGVAVGIVKDGEMVLEKGYGVRSVKTGELVDEHTCFGIASNSKAFTTAALAMLAEEGKLEWEDPVAEHIPGFRMYNDYVTRNFTVRDLLTHRSGLGLGAGDLQFWPSGSDFTINDMLVNFQHFQPVSGFRTKYGYDNILYVIAGELIRRASGLSWELFVKQKILEPLGMDHSYTLPPRLVEYENMASPHILTDRGLELMDFHDWDPEKINGAAMGILTNVDDMSLWMLAQLNGGKYGPDLGNQLFSEASHQEMWRIHTPMKVRSHSRYHSHFYGYGLGWRLSDMNGTLAVFHTGDVNGMLSKTILLPDLELGVVVLTNSYYGGGDLFQVISQTIVDSYLGMEAYDWIGYYSRRSAENSGHAAEVVRKVWETVENGDHSQITPGDYLGDYEDPWFGQVSIGIREGGLWFTAKRSPKLTGPMYHYKANAFVIKWEQREMDADAFALFSMDEEGKAQQITMKGISPEIDFSYDFQDLHFRRISRER